MKTKKSKTRQRTITAEDLLKLRGLTVLRDECNKQHRLIERSIAEVVKEEAEKGCEDYYGHVSDYMWDDEGVEVLLKNLDIKVIKNGYIIKNIK